jgi:dihydroneopterin aldolase
MSVISSNTYQIFIQNLILIGRVGIYEHEKKHPQQIRFSLVLTVFNTKKKEDSIKGVVDYALVIKRLESFLKDTHYNLVETLADRVMDLILEDRRVLKIKLKIEKLEAKPGWATTVGVAMEREQVTTRRKLEGVF